jgi:hypothetical protein
MVCSRCSDSFRIAEELYKRDPHKEALQEFTDRKREEKIADKKDISL